MAVIDIIHQVDASTRYLVRTPRGHLAVDVSGSRVEVVRCTDATRATSRDVREARAAALRSASDSEEGC